MTWQNPWAWAGLVALALPVLVHLLSRAPATLRPFPSLRFIDASRLSPRRRTRPRDLLLLLVRLGIVLAAVAALAGPSITRGGTGSRGVVRAIVVDTSASMRRATATGSGSMLDSARRAAMAIAGDAEDATTLVVETAAPAEALPGVRSWLASRPGTHEIVLVSDFQGGVLDAADVRALPEGYGMRFVRVPGAAPDSMFVAPAQHPAAAVHVTSRAHATELRWTIEPDPTAVPASPMKHEVTLRAGDAERPRLAAAIAATVGASSLGTRVHLDSAPVVGGSARSVDVVYPGFAGRDALLSRASAPSTRWMAEIVLRLAQDPLLQELAAASTSARASVQGASGSASGSAGEADSAFATIASDADGRGLVLAAQDTTGGGARLLLVVQADAGSPLSAALVTAVLDALSPAPDFTEREPLFTGEEELRALGRPATDTIAEGATSPDATRSLGRWLWALALLLLGVEAFLRRTAAGQVHETGERDQAVAA